MDQRGRSDARTGRREQRTSGQGPAENERRTHNGGWLGDVRQENESEIGEQTHINEGQAKAWEQEWAQRLPAQQPWIVRIDGRAFHSWTRGLERPFDNALRRAMVESTHAMVEEAGAWHAYTQSDEINLVMYAAEGQCPGYGGKLQKLVSLLAASATIAFNRAAQRHLPTHLERAGPAMFDARVFAVAGRCEACVALNERRRDTWRNAVQSVGHWRYGHRAMMGVKTREVARRLAEDGVGMERWDECHVRGVAIAKERVRRTYGVDEIERLPPRHQARNNPDLRVERTEVVEIVGPAYGDSEKAIDLIFGWRDRIHER